MTPQFTPQMLLAQNAQTDELKKMLESAMGIQTPGSVAQMQKEQRIPATQAATSPLSAPQQVEPVDTMKQKVSYSGSILSPQQEQERQAIMAQLAAAQEQNQADQRAGIDDYQKAMGEYQTQELQYDLRPLASVIDAVSGSNTYKLATDMITDTPETKRQKLMQMKEKLQGLKGSVSKDQLAYLKEQLSHYNDMIKMEVAERNTDRRNAMDMARMAATQGRFDERQVQALAKATESKASLDASVGELNNALGFDIDKYDPSTSTVSGKKVDLPGKSIPGVGRVSFYDEQARVIDDTMARIFNTELKDRSGAAVTNQELDRLKNEFSSGRFQTENEKLSAVKRYKKLLLEQLNRQESAFSRGVRETYKQRIADPGAKLSNPASGGLTPAEEAELKALEAEGY